MDRAGRRVRRLVREQAGSLHACALRHDEAAEALERHAREVDHLVAVIAAVERRVAHLLDSARHGLGAGLGLLGAVASHVAPDAVDHWLDHFRPPPSGSMEWLEVDVPRIA